MSGIHMGSMLFDVLLAFAGGPMASFAARSLVWHPQGPPWNVAVPLVAWTVLGRAPKLAK